jgi:hypothetical protein
MSAAISVAMTMYARFARLFAAVASLGSAVPFASCVDPSDQACEDGAECDSGMIDIDSKADGVPCITPAVPTINLRAPTAAGEIGVRLDITSNATSWGESGNEGVILELSQADRFIGHMILHQGATRFSYDMHLGKIDSAKPVLAKLSKLSASKSALKVCVHARTFLPVAAGADGDKQRNAPVYLRPIEKRFDDVPLLVGWSSAKKSYVTVYSSENGGTVELCGGGSKGMQAEISRWGRSTDIEGLYSYADGADGGTWNRCTGKTSMADVALRKDGSHPLFYYGDGHNRVFENRAGYGATCGSAKAEKPASYVGWGAGSAQESAADDNKHSITLRPWPVDLDPLGFATFAGRSEALANTYAPWIYRVASLELARERRIDEQRVFDIGGYIYADVLVTGTAGQGDSFCSAEPAAGGFAVSVVTRNGKRWPGARITGSVVGAGKGWKRVAIPVDAVAKLADIVAIEFQSFDGNAITLHAIADVFRASAAGGNGAVIDYRLRGEKNLNLQSDGTRAVKIAL